HHPTLLRVTFSAVNVSNCCHRLLLLPSSSIRVTSATIVCHCCPHLTLLHVTFSAAIVTNCCHRLLLLPSSFICVYHRLSLLPSCDTASCDIFCCSYRLLRMAFSAADVSYCCRHLPLPPSSSTAIIVFHCCCQSATIVRLPLLSLYSSAAGPMMISKEIPFTISDRPSSK
ncbi:hypothetical protein CDAR_444831, partial [Caerostris darwini]